MNQLASISIGTLLSPNACKIVSFGMAFFVKGDVVYFSELSPRPHDK